MIDTKNLFSLEGKRALITGASVGIGRRMAEVLAAAGARTVIVARRAEILQEMARTNPRFVPLACDLADPMAVKQAAQTVLEQEGGIDILVNNAAYIASGVKAEDETLEQIRTTLAVNLEAPILLAQTFYPGMAERRGGSIINISSIVANGGIGRLPQAVYAASKGGMEAIAREWAAQWSRFGVRVNCIAPGFIETEMTQHIIHLDRIQEWISRNVLIPRHGQNSDFDGALLFLASDASSYVTGQVVRVDGGWTAR